MFSQFRMGGDCSLSLVLRVVPSRSALDLFGLPSEVGERGARITEVLEGVAGVLHLGGLHLVCGGELVCSSRSALRLSVCFPVLPLVVPVASHSIILFQFILTELYRY